MERFPSSPAPKTPLQEGMIETSPRTQDEIIEEIDFILDHHEPLRKKWEALVEDLPLPKQLETLSELALKRREAMAPRPYVSEHLKILDSLPERAEALFTEALQTFEQRSEELDRGWNGKIMEYPSTDSGVSVVYKILIRSPIGEQNDLLSEASHLADLHELSKINSDVYIGVPKPLYCATLTNARVIAMEKVPGMSIENIVLKGVAVPDTFDIEALEAELLSFVHRINAAGFYHNDLRRGNIMIDLERKDQTKPMAYIIDTGNAKRIYHKLVDEKEIDNPSDRVMLRQAIQVLRSYAARQ